MAAILPCSDPGGTATRKPRTARLDNSRKRTARRQSLESPLVMLNQVAQKIDTRAPLRHQVLEALVGSHRDTIDCTRTDRCSRRHQERVRRQKSSRRTRQSYLGDHGTSLRDRPPAESGNVGRSCPRDVPVPIGGLPSAGRPAAGDRRDLGKSQVLPSVRHHISIPAPYLHHPADRPRPRPTPPPVQSSTGSPPSRSGDVNHGCRTVPQYPRARPFPRGFSISDRRAAAPTIGPLTSTDLSRSTSSAVFIYRRRSPLPGAATAGRLRPLHDLYSLHDSPA